MHRQLALQDQKGQKSAAQHFEHARNNPARPGHQYGGPPTLAIFCRALRQKAQKVHLLAHLHHQGKSYRGRCAKHQRVKTTAARYAPGQTRKVAERVRVLISNCQIRQQEQNAPHRLCPHLQLGHQRNAAHHHRNNHQCADDITPAYGYVQIHLQSHGHDGRFECKKDKAKARINQRGNGRAQIAKARTACQQLHIHAIARSVIANGQSG